MEIKMTSYAGYIHCPKCTNNKFSVDFKTLRRNKRGNFLVDGICQLCDEEVQIKFEPKSCKFKESD